VTFAKDLLKKPTKHQVYLIIIAWTLYLASIMAGFWSLMALTGSLAEAAAKDIGFNARIPAGVQIFLFTVGTLAFLMGGISSMLSLLRAEGTYPGSPQETENTRRSRHR
jgi:predicted phage tail protein